MLPSSSDRPSDVLLLAPQPCWPHIPQSNLLPVISLNIYTGVMQGWALMSWPGTRAPAAGFQSLILIFCWKKIDPERKLKLLRHYDAEELG